MTLDEVIERLQEYRDLFGGDCELRLMVQKQWPFECSAIGVVSKEEILKEEVESESGQTGSSNIVYIVEGDKICYGLPQAWDMFS